MKFLEILKDNIQDYRDDWIVEDCGDHYKIEDKGYVSWYINKIDLTTITTYCDSFEYIIKPLDFVPTDKKPQEWVIYIELVKREKNHKITITSLTLPEVLEFCSETMDSIVIC